MIKPNRPHRHSRLLTRSIVGLSLSTTALAYAVSETRGLNRPALRIAWFDK